MKNLVRQLVAQLTPSAAGPRPSDDRSAIQRAAVDQGALVDLRHS